MKKAHKRFLGYLGLLLVAAVTGIAAAIPSPETSATSSITDTIKVRVVGDTPNVDISGIENKKIYTDSVRPFSVSYENVETLTVSVKYVDADGKEHHVVLDDSVPDYIPDTQDYSITATKQRKITSDTDFSYGEYVVSAKGVGYDGIYDEDLVTFQYLPVYPEIVVDENTGEYYADLDYEPDNGRSDGSGDVRTIEIYIYDNNGNLIAEVSPVEVNQPDSHALIPLTDYDIPSGTYTAEVIAYDEEGNLLYKPYRVNFDYEIIPTPNTGKFFQNLNISKEDYLITGVIVFLVIGVVAFGIVLKGGRKTPNVQKVSTANSAKINSAKKANNVKRAVRSKKTTSSRKRR